MTTKYYALLTSQGAAKLANAAALGTKVQITEMAVGDGGGSLPTPDTAQTKLIGEKRRAPLNSLTVDAVNSSQVIAEQIIPENEGGFWIREIGLFDADGVMVAVANCAETYKPLLQEGSGRTQTVRMILIVNSTAAVTLKIDPSVVLATRKYADDKAIEVRAYADDLMAKHLAAADPHPQYAPKASPVFTGTPKAPTAEAGNNSTQLANTAFVQAALAALTGSAPAALDTLKELADAMGNDPNFSATVINALAGKMDKEKNGSDIPDVAAFLKNLGLGEAAKKGVGNTENQLPDMSFFSSLMSEKGCYQKLPSGMIIQGGSVDVPANSLLGKTITFPVAFPNFCIAGWIADIPENINIYAFGQVVSKNNSSMVMALYGAQANAAPSILNVALSPSWVAIGF